MSWSSGMSITRGLEAGAELNVFQEWNMVGKAIWEFVDGPGFVREEGSGGDAGVWLIVGLARVAKPGQRDLSACLTMVLNAQA